MEHISIFTCVYKYINCHLPSSEKKIDRGGSDGEEKKELPIRPMACQNPVSEGNETKQRIDKENEWLITVHPTQLKMKHTGTRHQRGTYCIGTSWQQWQNSVITNRKLGTFSSLLAVLVECIRAERLLFSCHYRSLFFPVQKEMAQGKARLQIWQVSCACSLQGPIYFPSGQCFSSLFLDSGGRYVLCSHWDVCRSSLDTNYPLEIWDSWEIPTFSMIDCVSVSRWHLLVLKFVMILRCSHWIFFLNHLWALYKRHNTWWKAYDFSNI